MRTKRKKIYLLLIIFLIAFSLVKFKGIFLEKKVLDKLNANLAKYNLEFDIGNIKYNFFNNLILENFKLKSTKYASLTFEAEKIFLSFGSFADLNSELTVKIYDGAIFLFQNPLTNRFDSEFAIRHTESVSLALNGRFKSDDNLEFKGNFFSDENSFKINSCEFFQQKTNLKNKIFTLKGEYNVEEGGEFSADFNHLTIQNTDILSCFDIHLSKGLKRLSDWESGRVRGVLRSYGTVVNQAPFKEVFCKFEIQPGKVNIYEFKLGRNFNLMGNLDLNSLNNINLLLSIEEENVYDLIRLLTPPDSAVAASGTINGFINVVGKLPHPRISGNLKSNGGAIGDLRYVSANVYMKGEFPILDHTEVRIQKEKGLINFNGKMDLRNIGQPNLFDDLVMSFDEGTIMWEGWNIHRRAEEINIDKTVDSNVKISFKTFMDNEIFKSSRFDEDTLELEYSLKGNKALKLYLREDEEVIGVEQRFKF